MPETCPTCGKPLDYPDAEICPLCGVRIRPPPVPGVTGEGKPAGVLERFGAYFVDFIVGIILMIVIFIAAAFFSFLLGIPSTGLVLGALAALAAYLLYYAYFESSESQATPGKMLVKIRVTDDAGRTLSFPRSLGRSFLKILFTMSPVSLVALLNAIVIQVSESRKGVHDYLAGTRVVTTGGHDDSGGTIIIFIAVIFVAFVFITVFLAAIIAAFVFGMAGQIEATKVVAATAQQTSGDHIVITFQGGQDAADVRELTATVTDPQDRVQTQHLGDADRLEPVPVGSTLEFSGDFAGKDHVVATALFTDGSQQVILDTVI